MSYEYSEDLVEGAAQDTLEELGWTVEHAWHKESYSSVLVSGLVVLAILVVLKL